MQGSNDPYSIKKQIKIEVPVSCTYIQLFILPNEQLSYLCFWLMLETT
jgi:hypothetical protein